MIIEVKNKDVYYPSYGGNLKLPEDERLTVEHRFLKAGERKKYIYTKPMKVDKATGKLNADVEYIQDEKGITQALVTGFKNFTLKVDGKDVEIKTVSEMYTNVVPAGLVAEIETHMLLVSPEVDKDFL